MTFRRVDHERIEALIRSGLTVAGVAEAAGVSRRTVIRARRRLGIQVRPPRAPLTAEELNLAKRLLEDGASYTEVGRTIGCRDMTVSKHLPGYAWTKSMAGRHSMVIRGLG